MAQRQIFVTETPAAEVIFAFPENHRPRLVNAIASQHIPTTNNTTEEVIRIFTQHDKPVQACPGPSAALKTSSRRGSTWPSLRRAIASPRFLRMPSKCPLEPAGDEVHKLPMAHLFPGPALQ